jgi:hypothetical protein
MSNDSPTTFASDYIFGLDLQRVVINEFELRQIEDLRNQLQRMGLDRRAAPSPFLRAGPFPMLRQKAT